MWSLDSWLAGVETEFWKAHNEVMESTGLRTVLNAFASSPPSSGAFLSGVWEEAMTFYRAVNWSEPFFRYLVAFHVVVWLSVLYGTHGATSDERLIAVCATLTLAVLAGMWLNKVGSRYASSLFVEPDVNYFSEDGFFIVAVYMAPLILLIVCLKIRMACRVVKLMVEVKRAQIRRKLRLEAKLKTTSDVPGDPSSEAKEQQ